VSLCTNRDRPADDAWQYAGASWPGNPRALITGAERRFPVRLRIAIPPEGLGQQHARMTAWLDENCGADGWAMTPSGVKAEWADRLVPELWGILALSFSHGRAAKRLPPGPVPSIDSSDEGDFVVSPAETLPYTDETFDLVYLPDVVHHLDIPAAMREVQRALKPGGVVLEQEMKDLGIEITDEDRKLKTVCATVGALLCRGCQI
jgi:SAM-dependent methyltransferase